MIKADGVEIDRIERFLGLVENKTPVPSFMREFYALFPHVHEIGLTAAYRLAGRPLKKLRDESAVLVHFLESVDGYDFVRQNLGNGIPDACLWRGGKPIDVEITVALARMRLALAEQINKAGHSSGFLTLHDDRSVTEFRHAADQLNSGYTTDEFIITLMSGIVPRVEKKSKSDRRGILLIDCPIGEKVIPQSGLDRLVGELTPRLAPNPFDEIFLVDNGRIARVK